MKNVPIPGQQASERFNIPLDIIWDLWNLDWPTRIRVAKYIIEPKMRVQS